MFATFRDTFTQVLKNEIKSLALEKKTCADNGSTMKGHLSFHCLKKFVLFHSMEGNLHNGKAC